MKVLYACSELFPFLKTGGLADVSAGLPPALATLGCEVRMLLPAFPAITRHCTKVKKLAPLPCDSPWGRAPALPAAHIAMAQLTGWATPVYLLHAPELFDRPGNPYLGPDGRDWSDNAQRFAALSWATAWLGQGLDAKWKPDVLHCHDWHTGLAPAYVQAFRDQGQPTPATVFSIHNLAYQGLFPQEAFAASGLPDTYFGIHGVEYYGQVSYMKAALQFSDRITTVSPGYAREILGEEQGCGLDGLLRERAQALSGILNGVDYQLWNPATDPLLPKPFDAKRLAGKSAAKKALQKTLGLEPRKDALVFGVVSRLTTQKGLHLLPHVLPFLVEQGGQLALLGQGDATLEQAFRDAAAQFAGQVGIRIGYDEATAHTVLGGSDVVMVPSAFEPCGLTQLYGLRYGTLPLVRRVGGLADTVVDCSPENLASKTATGFMFDTLSAPMLQATMARAFALFQEPRTWKAVQRRAMALQFDWLASARQYCELYAAVRH